MAKASPIASMAVVLAVGARLKGHASLGTWTLRTQSLYRAIGDRGEPVRLMILTEKRLIAGNRFSSSSDAPE